MTASQITMLAEAIAPATYVLVDKVTGLRATRTIYLSRANARRSRDRLDNKAGCYRYRIERA